VIDASGAGGSPGVDAPRLPRAEDPPVEALLRRCTLPDTRAVHVACSGGADSTALLALAVAAGHDVTAVHVDHGLRPGGGAEAAGVETLARRWGADFRAERVEVTDGPNLEERLREARREVLSPRCLLGHTADDQAETVVVRLLRGTGPDGLAAMDARTHPILGLRRADTAALCAHLRVTPFEDPTNADPRFVRNRVRSEVLPLLGDVAGRDVVPLLARLAELESGRRDLVDLLAAAVDPTDAAALSTAHPVVATAALRAWWHDCTGGVPPPDNAATARMMEVARGAARSTDVAAGWRLRRSSGRLSLQPAEGDGVGALSNR